jgi:hypothetical protein
MAAILPADFLIQALRRSTGRALARRRLLMVLYRGVAPQSPALGGLVGQQAPILTAIGPRLVALSGLAAVRRPLI